MRTVLRSQHPVLQALRYAVSGGLVLIADFAIYALILAAAPGSWLAANLAGKLTGAALGFVLHKYLTFNWDQRDGAARQAVAYTGLLGFNLALSSGLLWLLVGQAGWNAYLAKLLVDGIVIAAAFAGSRLVVYRAA